MLIFNTLTTNVPHHIETNQLICNANQLIDFYMMGNIGRSWDKILEFNNKYILLKIKIKIDVNDPIYE